MEFADILDQNGLQRRDVALALHKVPTAWGRVALAGLVETDIDAFEAYQSTHAAGPEATVRKRAIMASFLALPDGELCFVGLYRRRGEAPVTIEGLRGDAAFMRMVAAVDPDVQLESLATRARFSFDRMDEMAELRGRLVVADPGGRAYMRLAETTCLPVLELRRTWGLTPPAPDWQGFVVTAELVRSLPSTWAARLREWRGVYLIVDERDGARYVGSAYGAENLLGRWRSHVARDRGVTVELQRRDPATFRFSILELVAPTARAEDVVALESLWKERLHTRRFGLNAN